MVTAYNQAIRSQIVHSRRLGPVRGNRSHAVRAFLVWNQIIILRKAAEGRAAKGRAKSRDGASARVATVLQ